jgi:hypothetical protein
VTGGYAAATRAMTRAVEVVLALDAGSVEARRWYWLTGGRVGKTLALEMWDFEPWQALAHRQVEFARRAGALLLMPTALNDQALGRILTGELAAAARIIEEIELIAEATGNPSGALSTLRTGVRSGKPPD